MSPKGPRMNYFPFPLIKTQKDKDGSRNHKVVTYPLNYSQKKERKEIIPSNKNPKESKSKKTYRFYILMLI
jgi:hypothetical protein